MASNRRIGTETSQTRNLLLQAAANLMRDEGYAEVSSRKLARKAGLMCPQECPQSLWTQTDD